jgi:hypothetical protein
MGLAGWPPMAPVRDGGAMTGDVTAVDAGALLERFAAAR